MGELLPYMGGAWFWWIVAGVLLIGELMLPGVFLIWLAGAAALTGIADLLLGLGWQGELGVFAVFSLLLVLASWKYVTKQHSPRSEQPDLNQRQTGYVGRRTTLLQVSGDGGGGECRTVRQLVVANGQEEQQDVQFCRSAPGAQWQMA